MQVAFYLIDLLQDENTEVVKAADQALTVISEVDESWGAKLRALKFEAHNQIWLEACANGAPQQVSSSRHALAFIRKGQASPALSVHEPAFWCICLHAVAIHPRMIMLAKQSLYSRPTIERNSETECGNEQHKQKPKTQVGRGEACCADGI